MPWPHQLDLHREVEAVVVDRHVVQPLQVHLREGLLAGEELGGGAEPRDCEGGRMESRWVDERHK